ncbi:phage minor capsid protein [Agromyces atrinae]|uniref:phage minor capsid protein n=1 Tax=Agromyces atrinae TaxID=592376 RepID=UPI001F58465F|nr:phage minor capsid protein [Agromyces atrinae]MCI2959542.1 phage minor capsid protein [Agromyces atrinae]
MALFVPNPESGPVEDLIEDLARSVAAAYAAAEDELIREIAKRVKVDLDLADRLPTAAGGMGLTVEERRRQNRILAEMNAHRAQALRELQYAAARVVDRLRDENFARTIIDIAAREGEAAAVARLGLVNLPGSRVPGVASLTGQASQAVASILLSLESRLEALNQRLTRYPQDAYQRIVAAITPNTLTGVTTSRIQQAQTVQRFLSEGINGFTDRANRRWTIGAYAEMAGRTSVNRAFNDAAVWRMQQSGINLVIVVRGLDSCRKCADWAGKILSTDGTPAGAVQVSHATRDERLTVIVAGTVDQARNAGWNHPNCRCRLVAYMPGLSVPQGDTTYDEQAEKERAEQRRLEREIRAAKRREAVATDDVSRAKAAAEVRAAQGDMRQFISDTGRGRQSYREQLHFSDGS